MKTDRRKSKDRRVKDDDNKCSDCITNGLKWSQIAFVVVPLIGLVGSHAVMLYRSNENITLTREIVKSLNNTNSQLNRKGIIDSPFIVELDKNEKPFTICDNTIFKKQQKKKRIAYKNTVFDYFNFESKILGD